MTELLKTHARFDGATAWEKLRPEEQTEIGAIALELAVAMNGRFAYEDIIGWEMVVRPFETADAFLSDQLLQAVQEALHEQVPALRDDMTPVPIPSRLGRVCRRCGCSGEDACEGGCAWAEPDLCTACVTASLAPEPAAQLPSDTSR